MHLKTILTPRFSITVILCFMSSFLAGQKMPISGSVIDADNYNALSDAVITLTGPGGVRTTSPGAAGTFEFKRCPEGDYTIKVELDGYKTYEKAFRSPMSTQDIIDIVSIRLKNLKSRKRTRTVDYTRYDELMRSLSYSPAHAKLLLEEVNKTFTPEDEEYYAAYKYAGAALAKSDLIGSISCFETAIEARRRYFPFVTRFFYQLYPEKTANMDITNLATSYAQHGLLNSAIRLLEVNKDMARDPMSRATYLCSLGTFYNLNDEPEKAIEAVMPVAEILKSGQKLTENDSAWHKIYKVDKDDPKWLQKQQSKQKEAFEKTLKPIESNTENIMKVLAEWQYVYVLATAYFRQYDFEKALPYLVEYQNLNKEKDKLLGNTLKHTIAKTPVYLPDSVKQLIKESEEFRSLVESEFSESSAYVISLMKLGRKNEALQASIGFHDKAIYYHLNKEFGMSQQSYADLSDKLRTFSESKHFGKAVVNLEQRQNDDYVKLLCASGKFKEANEKILGDLRSKEQDLERYFISFSEGQRKEFMKDFNKSLHLYYSMLLSFADQDQARVLEVLNKSLQTKGLILDITRSQTSILQSVTDTLVIAQLARLKDYRDKQAAFTQQIQQAMTPALTDSINRYAVITDELQRKVNEKLGIATTLIQPVSWQKIQAVLKTNEALVEIVRIERENFMFDKPVPQYWAFVIKGGTSSPAALYLGEGDDFELRSLKRYQNLIRSQSDDNDSYNVYWKQISDAVGKSRVYLSSDGVYNMINPLTLRNPTTGKFLFEETDLVRISTGRDLLKKKLAALPITSVALLGNPDFLMNRKNSVNKIELKSFDLEEVASAGSGTRAGFSALPGTKQEVDVIAQLAGNKKVNIQRLEGPEATEAKVKQLKNPGVLHIATHGTFDNRKMVDSYLQSKLILAGAGDQDFFTLADYKQYEDGFLTAYEVTQLQLPKTQLVVLSACDTGLGEVQAGEGVFGLQRAFQLAGAKSVLGSLWKISDEATVNYMESFYNSYFGGATVQQAYNFAMTKTKAMFPHPYFWGAFVLNSEN
ncbi:MAG: CHAT domain-containing protein [Bacteroidetes bacterium]|nr:CHAT domain-containing protein [Bacteroidota bacterium]